MAQNINYKTVSNYIMEKNLKLEDFMEGEMFDEMVDSLNLHEQEEELRVLDK